MQREPQSIIYEHIDGPLRLVVFSDSAFKALDDEASGLALRSMVVLLTADTGALTVQGRAHMLDFVVRRLKRVVRSTFAAELNALIDAIEAAFLVQLVLHQVQCGTGETPEQLLHRLEHGRLFPGCDLFLDAKSVFDAVVAKDLSAPMESSLLIHIISIRDRLQSGTLKQIGWSDTRDMLADGLNKGSVPREPLRSAMTGTVTMEQNPLSSRSTHMT